MEDLDPLVPYDKIGQREALQGELDENQWVDMVVEHRMEGRGESLLELRRPGLGSCCSALGIGMLAAQEESMRGLRLLGAPCSALQTGMLLGQL